MTHAKMKTIFVVCTCTIFAGVAELVDARDLKSLGA